MNGSNVQAEADKIATKFYIAAFIGGIGGGIYFLGNSITATIISATAAVASFAMIGLFVRKDILRHSNPIKQFRVAQAKQGIVFGLVGAIATVLLTTPIVRILLIAMYL